MSSLPVRSPVIRRAIPTVESRFACTSSSPSRSAMRRASRPIGIDRSASSAIMRKRARLARTYAFERESGSSARSFAAPSKWPKAATRSPSIQRSSPTSVSASDALARSPASRSSSAARVRLSSPSSAEKKSARPCRNRSCAYSASPSGQSSRASS